MELFELTLLRFLRESKIKLEITGFDLDAFEKAMHRGLKNQLDIIQGIILEDSGASSDAEKVAAIKLLFERDFYL